MCQWKAHARNNLACTFCKLFESGKVTVLTSSCSEGPQVSRMYCPNCDVIICYLDIAPTGQSVRVKTMFMCQRLS